MNQAVADILNRYTCRSAGDYENALREIFQELALLGLWRGKFFERAAFYGGTALRIMHGLDRFSEDMDFSLLAPDETFNFAPYCAFIERELEAWGFPVTVEVKNKTANSAVESAFLKANTVQQMVVIDASRQLVNQLHRNKLLKIKIEVDTLPPPDFDTETSFMLQPIPFAVRTYTLPALFAGKMHALLFRKWGTRVKGRDWYDLVWYIGKKVPLDLNHLSARMRQTGHWKNERPISADVLMDALLKRIEQLDVDAARRDIEPFIANQDSIALWSNSFFEQIAKQIRTQ